MLEVNAAEVDLLDDKPQDVKADLRKFNKADDQVKKALVALGRYELVTTAKDAEDLMEVMKNAKKVETLIENKRKDLVKPFNDAVSRINTYAKELAGKIAPAILKGKDAVMKFQEAEKKKLIEIRNTHRHEYLVSIRLIHFPEGDALVKGNIYRNPDGITVPRFSLENLHDDQWSLMITRTLQEIEAKRQEKINKLKAEQETADFFADEQGVAEVQQKIDDVKAVPAAPTHIPSFGGSSFKAKGTTKTWVHEITDASVVPRAYLIIDESKIRDAIRLGVRDIPGIRIFEKESITLR